MKNNKYTLLVWKRQKKLKEINQNLKKKSENVLRRR